MPKTLRTQLTLPNISNKDIWVQIPTPSIVKISKKNKI